MARISNNQVRSHVEACRPFRTNNGTMFGTLSTDPRGDKWYAVYSYGAHFPMYVCDMVTGQWFGNWDKVSRTTSAHQGKAQPWNVDITWKSPSAMQVLAGVGPTEYAFKVMEHSARAV